MIHLQQQAQLGHAPNFAAADFYSLSRFYSSLKNLDDFFSKEEISDFVAFARKVMRGPDDHLKALWVNTDMRALHYRKGLVPTPPATWNELLAKATKVAKTGVTGHLFPGGRGEASVMEHLPMFWAQGGKLVDDKGAPVSGQGRNRDAMPNVLVFDDGPMRADGGQRT